MKKNLILISLGTLALSACEGTKQQLGITRTTPDEFAVVKRAPLEMPPDYTLRPPRPGAARPQEAIAQEQARTVVFGTQKTQPKAAPDNGEQALLGLAGADIAKPGIRETVDQETASLAPREEPIAEKLLGIGSDGDDKPPASVVDAAAEAARLQKNREEGKDITAGETPTIEE